MITNYVTVYNGSTNVTSKTSNWRVSSISPSIDVSSGIIETAGTYILKYKFTYDGETKETGNIKVTVTGTTPPSDGEDGEGTPPPET